MQGVSSISLDESVLKNLHQVLEEDFIDVLHLYRINTPQLLDVIDASCVNGDYVAAAVAAHTIKGSSMNLGLHRLVYLCGLFEVHLRRVTTAVDLDISMYESIALEYKHAQSLLDEYEARACD